jgi:hypothetical protein
MNRESGVKGIIDGYVNSTYIDSLNIEAPRIKANALEAHKGYIGLLAAETINADSIITKTLNTTPSGETSQGRIFISDNEIEVYSANEDKMIMRITGSTLDSQGSEPTIKTLPLSKNANASGTFSVPSGGDYACGSSLLGTITIPNQGCSYNLSLSNYTATITITNNLDTYVGATVCFDYMIVPSGESCPNKTSTEGVVTPPFAPGKTTRDWIALSSASGINGKKFNAGTYNVFLRYYYKKLKSGDNYVSNGDVNFNLKTTNPGNIIATPYVDSMVEGLTCLSSDGFRYVKTSKNYFKLDGNGYFTYYGPYGSNGMGVDSSGLWLQIQGSKYTITVDSSGNLKASKR